MINQPIQNGGLGERGSSNDKMRSAYDNYNTYRGSMENARQGAEKQFDDNRLSASASMSANGIARNSPEWNKTMGGVRDTYDAAISKAESTFEQYKSSPEYTDMLASYKQGTAFDKASGMNPDMFSKSKPTFDEFFDMQYGSSKAKNQASFGSSQRRSNALTMGARQ